MSLEHLFETESRWLTHKGKAYLSDRVVMHGKDLHKELGEMDWIHLYLLSLIHI